jgi:DNA (cytosine-5)-methyltransferase 3A
MTTNVDLKNETPTFGNVLLPAGAVGLRVLSLFDGMSCGQQALERIGINVLEYYASEIDKYAMQVTMANYPDTKQLGSVTGVNGYDLPKIDLLIGGSPCQSFSFAGKRKGMATKCETEILTLNHYLELKSDGYEFEGQSYLFWEFMRLLNECKPKYFLLENVEMGEKWEKVLSKAIGVNGIHINSSLVSAQNRKRIYWTNIGMQPGGLFGDLVSIIEKPKDKGILLKYILQDNVDGKYFLSDKTIATITRHGNKIIDDNENPQRSCTIHANYFKMGGRDQQYIVASRGRNPDNPKSRKIGLDTKQMLEARNDGKTNCLTSVQKDNLVMQLNPSTESNGCQPYQQNRIYDTDGISPALMAQMSCGTHAIKHERNIRRLTPLECERLQTVKDNYTNHVSDSQRYKMLGNGWTVDVIAHILSYGEWS